MKQIVALVIAAGIFNAVAATNVVTHTQSEAAERLARAEAWRETWSKMTKEERDAHRAEAQKRLAEARKVSKEVGRSQSPDGTITITYADGSVTVHKYPLKANAAK